MKRSGRCRLSVVGLWTLVCLGFLASSATALSAPGDGIKLGNATVTPYLEVRAISDSNVELASDNEADDVSIVEKVGIDLANVSDMLTLMGGVWGLAEQYSDLSDEDHEDFGENVNIKYGRRTGAQLLLRQSYQNVDQLDYGTGSIEQRENNNVTVGAGRDLTDKLQGDVAYGYRSTEYESSRAYDWDENLASIELAHDLTDRTAARITGTIGTLSSDANTQDADFTTIHVGLKTRRTQKLVGRVGVGYRDHDIGDDNISGFSFRAAASWQATPDVRIQVTADNAVEPASQNTGNYTVITRGSTSLKWQMSETVTASLTGMYRGDDYEYDVPSAAGDVKKESEIYT